jgi:hypothetical protein
MRAACLRLSLWASLLSCICLVCIRLVFDGETMLLRIVTTPKALIKMEEPCFEPGYLIRPYDDLPHTLKDG